MHTYTYLLPLTKGSTKTIHILNGAKEPVYTMKRTYKSIFHKIFDFWFGNLQFFCDYEGRNQEGEVIVKSKKKQFFIKSPQSILMTESALFCAQPEGIDAFTPTYHIEGQNVQMKVTIDFNKSVQFYEKGTVIAKLQLYFSKKKESELVITEGATIQNPLFYAIFAQTFYFVGDY